MFSASEKKVALLLEKRVRINKDDDGYLVAHCTDRPAAVEVWKDSFTLKTNKLCREFYKGFKVFCWGELYASVEFDPKNEKKHDIEQFLHWRLLISEQIKVQTDRDDKGNLIAYCTDRPSAQEVWELGRDLYERKIYKGLVVYCQGKLYDSVRFDAAKKNFFG